MFLYAPSAYILSRCPSAPAPLIPTPCERYVDALAELKAAEADYLTFRAAEREEALTRRLKELRLRNQEDQRRVLNEYFSEDAYQTYGLNNLGTYQRDHVHVSPLAQRQAFTVGRDFCCCGDFVSSVCPCTPCTDTTQFNLGAIGPSPTILTISSPKTRITPPRLSRTPFSSDNDTLLDRSTGLKHQSVKPQFLTPTLSSLSSHRREARSLRRPHPYSTLQPSFVGQRPLNRQNEPLKQQAAKLQSDIPLCQSLTILKSGLPRPTAQDMSEDELLEEFTKLFDVPATHGQRTDKLTPSIPGTVPSPCAETLYECKTLEDVDFADFFRAPPNVAPEPVTEVTLPPEVEEEMSPSAPTQAASSEGESDTTLSSNTTTNTATIDTTTDTTSVEITSSFSKIRTIEAAFNALKENFILPAELDFLPSTPSTPSTPASSDTETASATDHLTYSPLNRPVRSYEHALTVLLEQLDGVESLGDADVRRSRKEVVRRVERALEELEREVEGRWRVRVLEEGSEDNAEDEVSASGLDESESEREDGVKKEVRFDECIDVISVPFPIESIVEQDDPSITTTNTTSASSPDTSAPAVNTPIYHHVSIEAAPGAQHLVVTPVGSTDTTDFVPIPVQPPPLDTSTTDSLSSDGEPNRPISSTSPVLEPTPTTSSGVDEVNIDHEPIMLVNILAAAEPSPLSPSDASPTKTTTKPIVMEHDVDPPSVPAILVQGTDAELEDNVFFLISREAENSVSRHPNVQDGDDDWFEVDA